MQTPHMPAKIKLQSLFELLFKRLMKGVLLIVLLVFFIFSVLLLEYRNETKVALLFEKKLFDMQQLVHEASLEVDIWRLERHSTSLTRLTELWYMINARIIEIEALEASVDLETMIKYMQQLEMRHKRIVDIVQFDLDNPHEQLFDEIIEPAQSQLFTKLTSLVNISYQTSNLQAVKVSADLRAYFTKSTGVLTELSRKKSITTWQEYNQTLRHVEQYLVAVSQLAKESEALSSAVQSFRSEYLTFSYNVESYKRLFASNKYFDLDIHKINANRLNKLIDSEVTAFNEQYFQDLKKLELKLWIMIVLSMLLTLAGVLLGYRQLIHWKNSITDRISSSIAAISAQSKQIATGETTVDFQSNSNIFEIVELIDAISEIKNIVAKNARDIAAKQRVVRYKEKINQLQSSHHEFNSLVSECFDAVIMFSGGLAAALYLKSNCEDKTLTLFTTHSVSNQKLTLGQTMQEDLLQQVEKSREALFYDLSDQRFNVESALFTIRPSQLCVYPIEDNAQLVGVLELALPTLEQSEQGHLLEVLERFAMVVVSQLNISHTQDLLAVTETQKFKLSETMDELKQQHIALQQSEAELEVQADELKLANSQLQKQNEEAEYQQKRLAELNKTLKQTSSELKKASELKSQFLSKVSHELRTPLNSIIILIQTLIRKPDSLDEQQLKSLEIVHHSSQDLLELINDLLDMARIEAGEVKVHFDQYSIVDVVERVEALFTPVAQEKKLQFLINLSEENLPSIYTDIQRLQQVLRNLLSNAFKFTSKGNVTLSVSCDSQWFKFSVSDTGVGIKPEARNQIFDAFKQVSNNELSARQGTGLGLSISSQLAEVLGGRIELITEFGKGSTFTLLLPKNTQLPPAKPDGYVKPIAMADTVNKQTFLNELGEQTLVPSNQQKWQILGATPTIWHDLSTNKKLKKKLKQCDIKVIEQKCLDLENTPGLFVVLQDAIIETLSQAEVKEYLESITKDLSVVLITTEKITQEIQWLEALAKQSLIWNDETVSYLLSLVNKETKPLVKSVLEKEKKLTSFEFSAGRRVLIVEDDMRSLFSLSLLMKQSGIETELADNLTLAEEKIMDTAIDAVITDLVLPDGDGLSLIKNIRKNRRFDSMPIVVLSAKKLAEEEEKCLEAGANFYFDKPADVPKLLSILHQELEKDHG